MNKKLYRALKTLLILVLVISVGAIIRDLLEYRAGDQTYEDAARTAGLTPKPDAPAQPAPSPPTPAPEPDPEDPAPAPEPEPAPEPDPLDALRSVDLAALREVNPEVVGWIEIPDTGISYPLMQGANNQWYLKHTWVGDYSSVGAIFLDCEASPDLGDFHSLIYGHRLRSGAMFAPLRFYNDPDYWQEHPSIYIADDAGLHRYDVFAAHAVGIREVVYQLRDTADEEEQADFIRFCLDGSVIDTGIVPQPGDRILTLSTCTGDGYDKRWVVQGVLRQEPEEPEASGGEISPPSEAETE